MFDSEKLLSLKDKIKYIKNYGIKENCLKYNSEDIIEILTATAAESKNVESRVLQNIIRDVSCIYYRIASKVFKYAIKF